MNSENTLDPDKTVLLIGGTVKAIETAKSLGLDVIHVQHKRRLTPEQSRAADVTLIANYTDWSLLKPLIEAAYERYEFATALGLTDPAVEAAGRINDLIGLPGTSHEVSRRFRDKFLMRRRLAAARGASIGAELLYDRQSLTAFGARYGYPFIVKPTDATAGIGVFRVDSPVEIDEVLEKVQAMRATCDDTCANLYPTTDFVMEEFVAGPEFSVEAFSFEGRHVVVAISEKLTEEGHFAALGHTLPAPISPAAETRITAAVTDFLDVMGLTDGPSNTDVRIGSRGPVVIESHDRIAGDRMADLVSAAYGVDLLEYALGWPFGLVDELTERPRPKGGAAVRLIPSQPGTVKAIRGLKAARERPELIAADLFVKVGDTVRPLRDDSDRVGLLAVGAPNGAAAAALAEELAERALRVEVAAA
jgi:biotin carboxylase